MINSNLDNENNLLYKPDIDNPDQRLWIVPSHKGDGIDDPNTGIYRFPVIREVHRQIDGEVVCVGWAIHIGNRVILFRPGDIEEVGE